MGKFPKFNTENEDLGLCKKGAQSSRVAWKCITLPQKSLGLCSKSFGYLFAYPNVGAPYKADIIFNPHSRFSSPWFLRYCRHCK